MRKLWLVLAVILPVILCTISTGSAAESSLPFRVGVLYWSMNIPGQVAMRKGLEDRAASLNNQAIASGTRRVELICRVAGDGEDGILRQIEQMNELLAMNVDLIIVQPTDNAALSDCLLKANQQNIPVVAYDQYIHPGRLAAFRTSDNYQAGWLDGEYIAAKFANGRKLRLILVDYPHVSSTVERLNGFLAALSEAKIDHEILQTYQAVEPVSGRQVAGRILKDFPEKESVDVIFTVNDGGGLAIAEEIFRAGRTEIMHATIDGDPLSVDNIHNGRVTVIDSAQFCGPLGEEAMQAGYDILIGRKVPYHALVPVFPVTRETLSQYPGWAGPVPAKLEKSWKSLDKEWSGSLKIIKSEQRQE